MPYLDPSEIRVEQVERRVIVRTPFWSVTHDLSAGGAPAEIVFQHGQAGPFLAQIPRRS